MSVFGGEIGEMDELLMNMREACDNLFTQKTVKNTVQSSLLQKKEDIRVSLVDRSLKRAEMDTASDDSVEESMGSAKKVIRASYLSGGREIERFGAQLLQPELARLALDLDRLNFERERCETDRAERKSER